MIHKLGNGGFSTTWLGRDTVAERYYALKILKAEEAASCKQLRNLRWLAGIESNHPERDHVPKLVADFTIEGPNGQHTCLITDAAGLSVSLLYNVPGVGYVAGARKLRADIARSVIKQVAETVHFSHSHELCHGGKQEYSDAGEH